MQFEIYIVDLYREQILDHYRNPHNFGKLKNATHAYTGKHVLCGDVIEMEAVVNDGKISKIAFSGQACAISTASASLLTEFVKGKSIDEIMKLKKSDVLKLIGIDPTPTRLKCALLPLEVLQKMVQKVQ